jgi:hypothetical protein
MTKNMMLVFTLLCCSAWAMAQNPSDPATGSGTQGTPSGQTGSSASQTGSMSGDKTSGMKGNQTTIQGCLMGSGGDYTLTDSAGMQYHLTGDTSKLAGHENQQVSVKGMATGSSTDMSGNSPTATGTQGTGTATTAGNAQNFSVAKVKKISDSCTK